MVVPKISRTWEVTEVRYLYNGNVYEKFLYGSLTPFQVKRAMNQDERVLSAAHKKMKFEQAFSIFVQNSETTVLEIYGEKIFKEDNKNENHRKI